MIRTKILRKIFILVSILILIWVSYSFYWRDIVKSGLYYSDEGYFVQIVKTGFYTIKYFKNFIFRHKDLGSLKDYLMTNGGPFYQNIRQGYILLIVCISSLFLEDYYFYHGLQWTAFFGIALIFLTYLFVLRNFNAMSALISSLLLAFSSIYIAFARSVLTNTITTFFLLIGIFLYYDSFAKQRLLKFASLCFGFAFTCHYNVLWIFPIILFVEAYNFLATKRKSSLRIKTFTVFSIIPLICIEIITLLLRFVLEKQPYFILLRSTGNEGFLDYFSDLFIFFSRLGGYTEVVNYSFFYYFNLIVKQNSLIFVLLAIVGLVIIIYKFIKTKDIKWFFLVMLFFPFIFYSLIYNKADRMILPFIPIFCVYIGIASYFLKNKIKCLIIISVILIFAYQMNMSKKALKYQMDISEALSYMNQREGIKHICSRMYISHAYAGRKNAIDDFFYLGPIPGESGKSTVSISNLQNLYDKGYHYYLWYHPDNHELAKIARKVAPEITYFKYYNIEGSFARVPNLKSDFMIEAIKIYNVKKIIDYLNQFHANN